MVTTVRELAALGVGDESLAFIVANTYDGVTAVRVWLGFVRDRNVTGAIAVHGGPCVPLGTLSCDDVEAAIHREGERMLVALAARFQQLETLSEPEPAGSPTPLATSAISETRPLHPDALHSLFPTLFAARSTTGLDLTEAELREDLDQLFEHADLSRKMIGYVAIYRDTDREGGVTISLALFDNPEAAATVFQQLRAQAIEGPGPPGESLEAAGIGDEAAGRVVEPLDGDASGAVVVARQGRVVIAVVVQGNDPEGLGAAALAIAGLEADAVAAVEFTSEE
jgi:hypothetical protein